MNNPPMTCGNLSFGQERLWFLQQLNPQETTYNTCIALRLEGPLQRDVLFRACAAIIRRHDSLRMVFVEVDGAPFAKVNSFESINPVIIDCTQSIDNVLETTRQEIKKALQVPFDLAEGPLIRHLLLHFKPDLNVLIVCYHHIIFDGWSLFIYLKELSELYNAFIHDEPMPLPPASVQYLDFTKDQRERIHDQEKEKLLAYWKKQLKEVQTLQLPTDHIRTNTTPVIEKVTLQFPNSLFEDIKRLSQEKGITLFTMLFSAFSALLYRYTGQTHFSIGLPVYGREHGNYSNVIGFFVNSLPINIHIDSKMAFSSLLQQVKNTLLNAYIHQDVPLTELITELGIARATNRDPLFQVMFELDNFQLPAIRFAALRVSLIEAESDRVPYDIVLEVHHLAGKIHLIVKYNATLYVEKTIARMMGHWIVMLAGILNNPDEKIGYLPLLTEAERQQLLIKWNQTEADYPKDKTLHELIAAQAEKTPRAIAVSYQGKALTYAELNSQANQLAHYLQQLGIEANKPVAICLERSIDLIIGLLAILKAGGAYLPLDPHYPVARLTLILNDAAATIVITEDIFSELFSGYSGKLVLLTKQNDEIKKYATQNPPLLSDPQDIAYIIYTSGSTGKPKGTLIAHAGICNLVTWYQTILHVTANDRASQFASVAFDAFGCEVWPFLATGASVHLIEETTRYDPKKLMDWLNTQQITVCDLPTIIAQTILTLDWPTKHALRLLKIGGEKLNALPKKNFSFEIWNTYGPTETTIECIAGRINANHPNTLTNSPPLGRPINNCQVYILDSNLQPVPVGVPGELYVACIGLAKGYLHQPALTAQVFIENPFNSEFSKRLYKTGDICRYLADGNIDYIERSDDQVKIRGFRIELGEIERILKKHHAIKDAIVVAREDYAEKRLVAYWLLNPNQTEPTTTELRLHLKQHLPDYMLPSAFVLLETFPVTTSGKLDRKALPAPQFATADAQYVAPTTQTERRLSCVWCEILKRKKLSIDANFFSMGGHSLSLMQLLYKINREFNTRLTVDLLFTYQTIKAQADYIDKQIPMASANNVIIKLNNNTENQPLFCIHPVGGNVTCYSSLSQDLKEVYAVYGIQSRGLKGEAKPLTNIPAMAKYYLIEIKKIQPHGPYAFLGWSIGGLIAFEMAIQANKQNEKIALLVLIDTYDPNIGLHVQGASNTTLLKHLLNMLSPNLNAMKTKPLSWRMQFSLFCLKTLGVSAQYFIPLFLNVKSKEIDFKHLEKYIAALKHDLSTTAPMRFPLDDWISFLKQHALLPETVDKEQVNYLYQVWRNNFYASEHYCPSYFDGDLIYFESSQKLARSHWENYCRRLERIVFPVHHLVALSDKKSLQIIVKCLMEKINHG